MTRTFGTFVYCRPSDIISSQATWSAPAGTVDADPLYGLAALYDKRMARPLKFGDAPAIAIRVVADFGATVRIDGMALPNHNLPPGTTIKMELNATNVWTSPTVSVPIIIPNAQLDGHRASPWADFVAATGYSSGGFRYASLYVPATVVQPWLGELLVIARLRTFSEFPQFSGTKGADRAFLEHLYTEYAALRVLRRRIKRRRVSFTFNGTDADHADLQALADDAGGVALPFFFAADRAITDDGGLYGRFDPQTAAQLLSTETWFDLNSLSISLIEDSRSIPF